MYTSIIIPTFNRYYELVRGMSSLISEITRQNMTNSVEIIVVDDGSETAITQKVRDHLSRKNLGFVHYILLGENKGASFARNAGVQASRGELLIFLDDDIMATDNYISETIAVHRQHPEALLVNGNLRALRNDQYSGFWFYYYDAIFNKPGETFYPIKMVSSGNFSIKRDLLRWENPLFDDALPAREDYDLYLRLKKCGIPAYKADNVIALIECRSTLRSFIKQRLWYGRGQDQLARKHGAAFIADEQKHYTVSPNWKYLHLYAALRIVRAAHRLQLHLRRHPGSFAVAWLAAYPWLAA